MEGLAGEGAGALVEDDEIGLVEVGVGCEIDQYHTGAVDVGDLPPDQFYDTFVLADAVPAAVCPALYIFCKGIGLRRIFEPLGDKGADFAQLEVVQRDVLVKKQFGGDIYRVRHWEDASACSTDDIAQEDHGFHQKSPFIRQLIKMIL